MGVAARPGHFFSVYLLYGLNPHHQAHVFLGFIVHPARQVQQHNGDRTTGRAQAWHGGSFLEMMFVVHAFLSAVAALREGPLCCPNPGCWLRAHVICLSEEFLQEEPGQLLPLEGQYVTALGDRIWLCWMSMQEIAEDLELEDMSGLWPQPPYPTPCPGLPVNNLLASAGTLDSTAGDPILSVPNPLQILVA
uniref:Structure-specific endonuclease subunit SLX1 C-terminal domain-containing protein n=1 Tax=Piliocolobus tephrosceles TaxID=591936 RepID=A0A8C9LKP4_9PRIM